MERKKCPRVNPLEKKCFKVKPLNKKDQENYFTKWKEKSVSAELPLNLKKSREIWKIL